MPCFASVDDSLIGWLVDRLTTDVLKIVNYQKGFSSPFLFHYKLSEILDF